MPDLPDLQREPEQLQAVQEWRALFDGIASPILVVREDGTVVGLNAVARRLTGSESVEIGRRLAPQALSQPWQSAAELVATAGGHEGPITSTVRDPASGLTWAIEAFPAAPLDQGGRLISLVLRDITEMVALQETLIRDQTMSALGQLIAGVAHEVRSPLFGVSATLDAFEARFGAQADFRTYLENIRRELGRMNDLMRDLLELGKPATTPRRPEPIGIMLAEALQSSRAQAEQRDVALRSLVQPDHGLRRVHADRRRLVQVFRKLLENAIQHAPAGTEVTVSGSLRSEDGSDGFSLMVEDQGPGFRPEDLPRVFEPFFTRRAGGTGLGLSIVERTVEDHGGTVVVTNRPSGGAVVEVRLPLQPADGEDGA